jgi:predicted outer membrane lipoprotein
MREERLAPLIEAIGQELSVVDRCESHAFGFQLAAPFGVVVNLAIEHHDGRRTAA